MIVTITVPLPPKQLSPNARVHWAVKNKAKKAYQEQVQVACLEQKIPKCKALSAKMQLAFHFKTKARHDPDNCIASVKCAIDQLVKYGLLSDDDKITLLPTTIHNDKENPRLVVTLEVDDA